MKNFTLNFSLSYGYYKSSSEFDQTSGVYVFRVKEDSDKYYDYGFSN